MGSLLPFPKRKPEAYQSAEEACRKEVEALMPKWALYSLMIWAIAGPKKAQLFLDIMARKARQKHGLDTEEQG